MRIGIDARFLTHPQRGGFKTYTVNLINAISRLDDENQYFIYLDRPCQIDQVPVKKNFHYRVVRGDLPLIGMPLREQVLLRYHIFKDHLDILHSLCNTSPIYPGVKRITTLHDTIQLTTKIRFTDLPGFKYWIIMAYSKWSIKRAVHDPGRIITVSQYEKLQILDLFDFPDERVVVTHLAANPLFKPVAQDGKATLRAQIEKKFGLYGDYILGVGYEDRKNIPLLIDAYRHLAPDFPKLNLVIVSAEENKRLHFQQMAKDSNLNGRVTVLGSIPALDLFGLYNLAKVFVFPSERESFGLPPLEAIACGTPTIAMNSSSLLEILEDSALLVEGKDSQNWASVICTILTDEKLRLEMIKRGLGRAAEMSWENCARKTIQAYERL